jgi:hypothetical protein
MRIDARFASVAIVVVCLAFPMMAEAKTAPDGSPSIQDLMKRLDPLEKMIKTQQSSLEEQKKKIAAQEKELKSYRDKLAAMEGSTAGAKGKPGVSAKSDSAVTAYPGENEGGKKTGKIQTASSDGAASPGTSITGPKKEEEARPQLDVLPDYGGVLTPKGTLMYEHSIDYTNTTNNIFTFNGVQVAEVVLIGQIEATSARRQIVQNSARLRLGITDRLEADVRVPYAYRNDAESRTSGGGSSHTAIEGSGFGDIDVGMSYQINRGTKGWPYFIGNMRFKSDSGDGPYDVGYDANNVAKTLPTGTGFKTVEGSATVIKVSDPAVLFGNLGYVYSLGEDVNKTFNETQILNVSPGGAINASTGMGFSINQETSFTLGYKHSYVFPTYQHAVNTTNGSPVESRSDTLNVGALLVGTSYRLSPAVSLNLTTEVGATRDAPDVVVGLRVPVRLGQFF